MLFEASLSRFELVQSAGKNDGANSSLCSPRRQSTKTLYKRSLTIANARDERGIGANGDFFTNEGCNRFATN